VLFGKGRQIGPDLTPHNRNDLPGLLLSIVNPSAEIREGYETQVLETTDERSLSGFLAGQNHQTVMIRGLDGQVVSVPRREVASMRASAVSLMPEGLLDAFDEQQVRDLLAYLRSSQPLVGESVSR
jgi:putative heme-binding domain-containing protein